MFFFYLDASADSQKFALSAVRIHSDVWREAFNITKAFRSDLKRNFGVFVRRELHAVDLVGGRGKYTPPNLPLFKFHRARVFEQTLECLRQLPGVQILNVCITVPGCPVDPYLRAFERLMNRVEVNLSKAKETGVMIIDEGKEGMIRRVARQMSVFNWIPSKYGGWANGDATKKILVSKVLEDPIFRRSDDSYFLQFADAAAFALLKREVGPTPNVAKYGIDKMFEILKPVLCLEVSKDDPYGIERG